MNPEINDRETLIHAIQGGYTPAYLFFWGHQARKNQAVGKQCLSQWWPTTFEVDGIRYRSAEQYMMAEKARLFEDTEILEKVLTATEPAAIKQFGRYVHNFNEETWVQHRFEIVRRGNIAKFDQNDDLKLFLLGTRGKVLVEASPVDTVWGIGLAENDPLAQDPAQWHGLNLLGFALMSARASLG